MARTEKILAPKKYIFGDYAVGTTCFSIVDEGRQETLGNATGDRRIAVRLYYPVDKESVEGLERAVIFSEQKKTSVTKAFHLRRFSDEANVAEYYENAPFAAEEEFPLVMFSSAYQSYIEANTYLLCAMASYGYIIASVGHAYEFVENDYEDGSFDLFDKQINKDLYTSKGGAIFAQGKLSKARLSHEEAAEQTDAFQDKYTPYLKERVKEWKLDMEKALEEVKARYADHIDLDNGVGVSGHSYGGCLAYYLCRYNEEFTCGINIDGALFGEYDDTPMKRPFCQISCPENINLETRPFVNTTADTYQVTFGDLRHLGFSDMKFYMPGKLYTGKLDSEEMFRHLVYCHVRFFDKYLKAAYVEFRGMSSEKIKYKKIV